MPAIAPAQGNADMLRIHFADNRQSPVWLADERFTLGSDRSNRLAISDAGVAPFHAELILENRFYYLTDLGTPGGTYVNDEKIGERYQIRSGDRVRLGALELEIVDPAKVGAKVAAKAIAMPDTRPLKDRVERMEATILMKTLVRCRWNKSRAAEELGLSRVGLRAKLDRYGIARGGAFSQSH
jgi:hypothetical protein